MTDALPLLMAPTGDIRKHEGFHSRYLERDRTVVVYLPPRDETKPDARSPVLYMHDGQNLFDDATAFAGEWRVDELAQELIGAGAIQPLIIVGVYNTDRRVDEYTPTTSTTKGADPAGGLADAYGRMLVEELKPFIDATYPTLPGPATTAMAGSSLGALVTLHLGLRYPAVFGKLAVLSPSIWWDDAIIVREVEALQKTHPARQKQQIWLDAGTREGEKEIADVRRLRDALVAKGWIVGKDLRYAEIEGGEHNERSWGARMKPVLEFLFPRR